MEAQGKGIYPQRNNSCADCRKVTTMLVLRKHWFIGQGINRVKETIWSVDVMETECDHGIARPRKVKSKGVGCGVRQARYFY